MMFPRLKYGTVVDDDSRPRGVSLAVAALVVLVLAVAGGFLVDNPRLVSSVGLITGSFVGGLALLERDRFGSLVVGTLLAVPVGTVFAGWTALQLLDSTTGLVTAGVGLAILGIGLSWAGLDSHDDVERTVDRFAVGYGGVIAGGLVPMVLYGGFLILQELALPTDAGVGSVFAAPVSAAVFFGAAYLAARTLPFVPLAQRSRRAAVAQRVATARRVFGGALVVAILVTVLSAFLAGTGIGLFLRALSTPIIVWPLTLSAAVLFGLVGIAVVLARLTRDRDASARRRVAAVVAGAFVSVVLLVLPLPPTLLALVVLVLLVGPVAVIVAAVVFGIAIRLGVVPERAAGLTLASAGLAVVTVGAALAGLPGPFVFAAAAGTVVVWDVSTYGLGVTAELGHVPETRRLELVHAVVAVGVGAAAVVAASLLYGLRTSAGIGTGVTAAAAAAVVGAVIALLPMRG